MKKQLGFSLIELMVVVAIIAFLSAIGMAVYADVQARGRDTKRKADIDSIAKVLEIHKTDIGYQPLQTTWFGSSAGTPTADPKSIPYCISTSATSDPTSAWTAALGCPGGWIQVANGLPAATTTWRVCTYLENPAGVYCRYNVQ